MSTTVTHALFDTTLNGAPVQVAFRRTTRTERTYADPLDPESFYVTAVEADEADEIELRLLVAGHLTNVAFRQLPLPVQLIVNAAIDAYLNEHEPEVPA